MKKLQFVKIKGQCGHVNLIPVTEVFHVPENIKCEKCGKVIAEPNARAFACGFYEFGCCFECEVVHFLVQP